MTAVDVGLQLASVEGVVGKLDEDYATDNKYWKALESIASLADAKARETEEVDQDFRSRIWGLMVEIIIENPELTFQHIEAWLRRNDNTSVWVVGVANPMPEMCDPVLLDGSGVVTYALRATVRTPTHAMDEIVAEGGGSYAANFARLRDTGFLKTKMPQGA